MCTATRQLQLIIQAGTLEQAANGECLWTNRNVLSEEMVGLPHEMGGLIRELVSDFGTHAIVYSLGQWD